MITATMKATFTCDAQKLWNAMTNLKEYHWRSDIASITEMNSGRFVEYTHKGFATTFSTTYIEPFKRWEFDLENDNMSGHWTGILSTDNGITTLTCTEAIIVKKAVMKPVAKVFLNRQQKRYMQDLRKVVE